MLETIAIILIILWLLGLVSSYTLGGFIHILLVVAIIMILIRVVRGRRPAEPFPEAAAQSRPREPERPAPVPRRETSRRSCRTQL